MIFLLEEGQYRLIETKGHTKILILEKKMFAWVNAAEIGEILVTSHKTHEVDHLLTIGKYRLYEVRNEPKLKDSIHLELSVGHGYWQGYVLPTGLPNDKKKRNRIIPTNELISKT